jgi:hypothetical protein
MKELMLCSFMVLFSVSARAQQFGEVGYDFRMAQSETNQKEALSFSKKVAAAVFPTLPKNQKIIFTFYYVIKTSALINVETTTYNGDIDPSSITANIDEIVHTEEAMPTNEKDLYYTKWCLGKNYNAAAGCTDIDGYAFARAPK